MRSLLAIIYLSFASLISGEDIGIPRNQLNNATLQRILSQVFKYGGIIATIMVIVGGIMYVVSAGNETKLRQAKAIIFYSVIGLVIMLLSLAIVSFVVSKV